MKYTAHILSHTHWDREWYLNSPYTNEWLIPFFDGLFTMLEKEKDYKFILDGQLSMIEDYFEELSKNSRSVSDARRRIRSHVERGALFIGPYYLQPDWQLLSEESLVRNLLVGSKLANELGGSMKSGWLLDNFGQISQTAQLHKLAGLEGLYAWRGVAMDPEKVSSEFLWEAPDGTQILSVYLLNSYRNVMRLAEYSNIMGERMDAEVEKLKPFATTSNLLMMNGYDQEMIPDDIQPHIRSGKLNGEDYETIQNSPDGYLQAILAENPELPVLKGALYNGRFISVFPGVMSARMYLKLQNDAMQKLLEQRVEPISFMAFSLGGEYGASQIDQAWKLLLKNHPHDSICGVSIDNVHTDMENRTRQVHQLGSSLLESQLGYLATGVDTSSMDGDEALVVFNTMLRPRDAVVRWKGESRLVRNIPAMGFKVSIAPEAPEQPMEVDCGSVENEFIRFEINDDGSFNLLHKETGRQYRNMGILEDMGDSGDEYNYSYPDEDLTITSSGINAEVSLVRSTEWEVCFRVSFAMSLPVGDVKNHTKRSRQRADMPVVIHYTVEAGSPVVKCRISLRNTVRDHRVRVLMPSGYQPETVYAASPFDITERPVHIEDYNEEDIPEHVRKVIIGAREAKPSTYFHTREFLDVNDGSEGLSVFNKGLPEYQVIDKGTIALTLFRSVGWIAKKINTRLGDAGPEIYTPDAQCLREMTFEYAVCPHNGDAYSGVTALADEFNNDAVAVTTGVHSGPLGWEKSWLSLEEGNSCIKVTGLKRSEDGRGLVVRGVNLAEKEIKVQLNAGFNVSAAVATNLLEIHPIRLETKENRVSFPVSPRQIFTVRLETEPERILLEGKDNVILENAVDSEDFSAWPYSEYVTDEDIQSETERAAELEKKINDPMWRRTALEAQLSVILSRHRKDEVRIRELGYRLNEARVHRRIQDYLSLNFPWKKHLPF